MQLGIGVLRRTEPESRVNVQKNFFLPNKPRNKGRAERKLRQLKAPAIPANSPKRIPFYGTPNRTACMAHIHKSLGREIHHRFFKAVLLDSHTVQSSLRNPTKQIAYNGRILRKAGDRRRRGGQFRFTPARLLGPRVAAGGEMREKIPRRDLLAEHLLREGEMSKSGQGGAGGVEGREKFLLPIETILPSVLR